MPQPLKKVCLLAIVCVLALSIAMDARQIDSIETVTVATEVAGWQESTETQNGGRSSGAPGGVARHRCRIWTLSHWCLRLAGRST